MLKLKKPQILEILGKSKSGSFLQIIYFIGFFLVTIIIQSIVQLLLNKILPNVDENIIFNFTSLVPILLYILIFKIIKHKEYNTFGYKKDNLFKDYFKGLLVGLILSVIITILCLITNIITLKIKPFNIKNILLILLLFISYIFQALNEETLIRGHLLIESSRKSQNIWIGLITSSIVFTLLHISNSIIGSINILLLGFLFGLIFIKKGSLWMSAGIHAMWNFMLNALGVNVSGIESNLSLFTFTFKDKYLILNGGTFGYEGSILLTIITIIMIILAFKIPQQDTVKEK